MAKCDICDNEQGTVKYHDMMNEDKIICIDCAKEVMNSAPNTTIVYKWELYEYGNNAIWSCGSCWWAVHKDILNVQGWICLHCKARRAWISANPEENYNHDTYFCPECHTFHTKWLCNAALHDNVQVRKSISFNVSNENKERGIRWEARKNKDYISKIWQYQIERDLTQNQIDLLNNFYRWYRHFKHYYTREPYLIEWEVSYSNYKMVENIHDILTDIRDKFRRHLWQWLKTSKYYNYYVDWIDDKGLIRWKFIDVMWNLRERSESVNKFLLDVWQNADNSSIYCKFKYRISSDINHKIDAFKLNERVWSCQKSNNCESYARWAYDAVTNWCNCPLLIYTMDNKLIARITTRIMYDKEWKEYLLMDRIYHSWEFSDSLMKWEIYKAIVLDLKDKWVNIIASPYSAHDRSTYAYLCALWMKAQWEVHDLCQPLRRVIWSYWYYCDWWTQVYEWELDWITRATDYLDKAYLF